MLKTNAHDSRFQLSNLHLFLCIRSSNADQFTFSVAYQNGDQHYGAIQVLRNAFFMKIVPQPTPRNANNVEPYTSVMLFPRKSLHLPPPSVLRNVVGGHSSGTQRSGGDGGVSFLGKSITKV